MCEFIMNLYVGPTTDTYM